MVEGYGRVGPIKVRFSDLFKVWNLLQTNHVHVQISLCHSHWSSNLKTCWHVKACFFWLVLILMPVPGFVCSKLPIFVCPHEMHLSKLYNIFVQIGNCISLYCKVILAPVPGFVCSNFPRFRPRKMYLSKLSNVVAQIAQCICQKKKK